MHLLKDPDIYGWKQCLENAAGGNATDDDIDMLEKAATSWSCCAVGERLGFPDIEGWLVDDIVEEHDPEMYKLGNAFFEAVDSNDWKLAIEIHGKINDPSLGGRVESLKRELKRLEDMTVEGQE